MVVIFHVLVGEKPELCETMDSDGCCFRRSLICEVGRTNVSVEDVSYYLPVSAENHRERSFLGKIYLLTLL